MPIKKKSNLLFFHKIQIIIYILMRRDFMNESIKKRVLLEAKTIIETQKTLRDMEQLVQVSNSTIHKDMQQRLIELDEDLYEQVQNIFENHIKIRHIHGGESTKKKYMSKLKKL
jgi:putative DeoR family transcriptional regulator (stage III sporulation protein D)